MIKMWQFENNNTNVANKEADQELAGVDDEAR